MVFIFNYIKIAIWSFIYYFQKDKSDIIIKIIVNNIRDSGCVAIKFTQWILPKIETIYNIDNSQENNKWFKYLEELYEDCNYHDINYTKKLYYKEFKSELEEDYDIISLVASGSIGQVYKVKDKYTKIICAMKVVHPDLAFQLIFFDYFIRFLYLTPIIRNILYYYIPIELKEFVDQFRDQSCLINETNNCLRFYEEYKDNDFIVIPKVYKVSEKIMVMKYEGGMNIDDKSISSYNIYKLLINLKIFIQSNELIFNFMHGDLHKGNIKVRIDNGLPKLVIYDFGFCWKSPKYLTQDINIRIMKAFGEVEEGKENTVIEYSKACWLFINKVVPQDYLYNQIKRIKKEKNIKYDDK